MNDFKDKVTENVKQQIDQANELINKCSNACKGLFVQMSQKGSTHFNELAKTGKGRKVSQEIISTIKSDLQSPKHAVNQFKNATFGLILKINNFSNEKFNEFAKIGEKQGSTAKKKAPAKKTTAKAA